MSEDFDYGRLPVDEQGEATGPLQPPRLEEPAEQPMNPNLRGVPETFPEGMGLQWQREQEEEAQVGLEQVWRDTIDQSVVNSTFELLGGSREAMQELFSTGPADLEQHREELTRGVPLHLQDEIMGSMTYAGAVSRRERLLRDLSVSQRLSQQTGLSRNAVMLAGGLLDADLPLIFATGGTLAAGRTALGTARATRALTGSTALARTAGDVAVGVTGGALSGAIVGGLGAAVRDDYGAENLFQMIMAGAATGGVLNPALGRVLPDRDVWEQAASIEAASLRNAERDIQRQLYDPEAPIHDMSSPVNDAVTPGPVISLRPDGTREVQGSEAGAAQARPAEVEVQEDTLGLSEVGAPESVVQTSTRLQQWQQDTSYRERYEEDTANPIVRMLVGGSDYSVRLPVANVDVPLGRMLGSVLTLAQRDFTLLAHSRSPGANFVAAEILESASGLGRRGSTAGVLREMFHSSALVHSAAPLRDFRANYFRSRGLNPVRIGSHRQFSADLRLQMQRRAFGQDIDPDFKEVMDRIDRTNSEILGHMRGLDEDRSVRGARDIEDRPGWFRYDWAPERFRDILRTSEGKRGLIAAFARGYMRASGLDAETAEQVATAIVRRFQDRGVGVSAADSRLLDLDSRAGIEQVLEESALPRGEIDRIMKRLDVNTQERTRKGYLKNRIEVDLSTSIPGTDQRLVDLMSDDFERSLHQYVGDASGAAALAHKGIRDQADMNNLIDTILFEQQAVGETALTRPQLEAIFSQFTGTAHKGFMWGRQTSGVSPLVSTLTKATRASLLQRAGLTQLMDTANLFVANGVARTMEPVMARLGWDKAGNKTVEELTALSDELQSIGVIVGQDQDIFAPHLSIDETDLAENVLMNSAQRGMSTVERATHFVSGQIHVTAMQQRVAASAVTTNVLRTLAGHETNLTTRMLRDLGLEGDNLAELEALISAGTIKVDGAKIEMNTAEWSPELRLEFGAAMLRGVHQQAQKSMVGETSVWMNTDIGKLLTALKTFSMVATQKQMARNLMIGGSTHFAAASAWQLGFAYSVLTLAQTIQGQNMDPSDRAWLAAAYTPNIGAIPMLTDPMTSMLGFDDLNFSPYGRYASYLDTPVFSQIEKLSRAPGAVGDMLSGEGTYTDMQNARAMFFLNWYGMKQLWESM